VRQAFQPSLKPTPAASCLVGLNAPLLISLQIRVCFVGKRVLLGSVDPGSIFEKPTLPWNVWLKRRDGLDGMFGL